MKCMEQKHPDNRALPTCCPSCGVSLRVRTLCCPDCGTQVTGDFPLPAFARLAAAEQRFLLDFVLCSGSLKELAARLGVSYPTVRNRLDEVIDHLKNNEP